MDYSEALPTPERPHNTDLRSCGRNVSEYTFSEVIGEPRGDYSTRRKGVFKYFPGFSGAGEVSDKYIYRNNSPAPEKYSDTLLRAGEEA